MNILIITSVYPRDDAFKNTSATKVIHYFAEEWKKQGHNVFVVHTSSRLLKFTYVIPQRVKDFLKAKTGNEFPDLNITKKKQYIYEGIKVFRRPVFKLVPRSLPFDNEIKRCANDIRMVLEDNLFIPDVIIGHWAVPQIQILVELGKFYDCKKSIVLHDDYYIKKYKTKLKNALSQIDVIGCRSKTISESVGDALKLDRKPFVCYSGVPDEFVKKTEFNKEKFRKPITKFIYVGELIKRKHCDTVIEALNRSGIDDWQLDIVGQGNERENLENSIVKLGLENNVVFHGRVQRERVFELMSEAQCFIMPSKGEAFGLVYLEAMVASCISVGSKKEGIDGIIKQEENGFLVKAGNCDDLVDVLKKITSLNNMESTQIALNGYNTAREYTDSNVAKKYLEAVLLKE